MANKFILRFPEESYLTVVSNISQGPVFAKLLRHGAALPILIDEFIKVIRVGKPLAAPLRCSLIRWVTADHKMHEGYDKVLTRVLGELSKAWSGADMEVVLSSVVYAERHGFAYRTLSEFIELVTGFRAVLRDSLKEDSSFVGALANVLKLTDGLSGPQYTCEVFHQFLHLLSSNEKFNCLKYRVGKSHVLAPPFVPAVVLRAIRVDYDLFQRRYEQRKRIGMPLGAFDLFTDQVEGWLLCKDMLMDGFLPGQIMSFLDRGVKHALKCLEDGETGYASQALHQILGTHAEDALLQDSGKFCTLAMNWGQCDMALPLLEFHRLGGTVEACQDHLATQESERKRLAAERAQRDEVARKQKEEEATRNAPKGVKRGQHGYVKQEEPVEVDFAALCSELNVHALFPELNEPLTRILLVHGLLREGDRLANLNALPVRDQGRLWRQVKPYVSLSSAKTLKRPLSALTKTHLVTFKGGNYQLSSPNTRFPQAHALLTQLRALLARYSS